MNPRWLNQLLIDRGYHSMYKPQVRLRLYANTVRRSANHNDKTRLIVAPRSANQINASGYPGATLPVATSSFVCLDIESQNR